MRKKYKAALWGALCAAVICAAGCSLSGAEISAVSESSVISDTDAVSDSQSVSEETLPAGDCSVLHSIVTDGRNRRCSFCGSCGELPVELPSGYITETDTVIEAGGIKLTVDKGIYVPGDVEEKTTKLISALETVSGLSFSDAKYNYNTVNVHVAKVNYIDEDGIASESEAAGSWAASGDSRDLEISAGDLFLGNSYAIAHELSHTLNFSNSSKFFCDVAREGFAEYNCFKAIEYLEQVDPEAAQALGKSDMCTMNMDIHEPSAVYTQSVEYWMENGFPFEYSGNGSYSLGFRFMAYLDDAYGDYSKWITASEDLEGDGQNFPMDQQFAAFRTAYGDDVFDGFYPWLKKNEKSFTVDYGKRVEYDLQEAEAVTIYPYFMSFDCPTEIYNIRYSDLYVNLEEAKRYLNQYKNRAIDDLVLDIRWSDDCDGRAELFDAFGNSLGVLEADNSISLDDVSFLLLKGEGTIAQLSINGYERYPESE